MITFEQIKNSNPLLIVYPGGSGGEFVANIISQASKSFNKLPNKYNEDTNRIEVSAPLKFQHEWTDMNDPTTWITPEFEHQGNNLRYVLRLHPDAGLVNNILNHMPNVEILYMTPLAYTEYFAKLLFIKTSYKITQPVNGEQLRKGVTASIDDIGREKVAEWINSQNYPIWSVDLGELCYLIKNNKDLTSIRHSPDPMQFIRKYMYSMHLSFVNTCQHLEDTFDKVRSVNSDSLTTDGIEFWNNIKIFVPDLDLEYALLETNKWISRNNKLIEEFDNDNNL